MTILVAGLVIGGWALLFGLAAIVVTGLGWLRDARREFVAVEAADRTGHLDLGGSPAWPTATFAALAIIIAGAVLLSSGVLPNAHPPAAAPSGAPAGGGGTPGGGASGGGGGTASEAPSLPAADVTLVAQNISFDQSSITIPAGKPFTIAFDNRDPGIPHDVVIKGSSGDTLFQGDLVTGPKAVVYNVPAIPAGTYTFVCSVHPNMTGTVTAQ
jgi:plastocyanin